MASDVPGHLAAARGVANVDRILQVRGFDQRCDGVSVGVQVVTIPRLARAAVAATVVRDAPVAAGASKNIWSSNASALNGHVEAAAIAS
jgi:hypothetical protein